MLNSKLDIQRPEQSTLEIVLAGDWKTGQEKPYPSDISKLFPDAAVRRVRFDSRRLNSWDSALAVFLSKLDGYCRDAGIDVGTGGLPHGARRLLALAAAVPKKADAKRNTRKGSPLERIADAGIRACDSARDVLSS